MWLDFIFYGIRSTAVPWRYEDRSLLWPGIRTRLRWHAISSETTFVSLPSSYATVQNRPPNFTDWTGCKIVQFAIISAEVVWPCFPCEADDYKLFWFIVASWYGWLLFASGSLDFWVPPADVTATEGSSCITWNVFPVSMPSSTGGAVSAEGRSRLEQVCRPSRMQGGPYMVMVNFRRCFREENLLYIFLDTDGRRGAGGASTSHWK